MGRGDLSDAEWDLIGPLLPPERGRCARPAGDNRRFLNGILHVLRIGCPWRDMHERYRKWNSVYVRFRRWGVTTELGDPLIGFHQTSATANSGEPAQVSSQVAPCRMFWTSVVRKAARQLPPARRDDG